MNPDEWVAATETIKSTLSISIHFRNGLEVVIDIENTKEEMFFKHLGRAMEENGFFRFEDIRGRTKIFNVADIIAIE